MKTIRWYLCAALLAAASVLQVQAQTAELDVKFDSTWILIGDQIKFNVMLEQTGPMTVTFPDWKDTLIKAIEILDVAPRDTVATTDGKLRITQELVITSFDSGLHFVPPMAFPLYAAGVQDTIFSPVAGLQVFTMPLDTAQAIFDIKPIYKMPVTGREVWQVARWVLLGIAVAALLVFLWLVLVKKKKPSEFFRQRVIEPPHVVALRSLEQLRREKLWQNGQTKAYYTRLTEIVRTYISGRYGVNAMESTSDEILRDLRETGFNDKRLYEKLSQLFACADLVKFARMMPEQTENDAYLLDAVVFVNTTKLLEEPTVVTEAVPGPETPAPEGQSAGEADGMSSGPEQAEESEKTAQLS